MDPELTPVIELLIALFAAIIAFWQNQQKKQAQAETVQAQNQTTQVVSFFDPQGPVSIPPPEVPARSWLMNDETKRWITFDHSPEEQQSLLRQITEAEAAQKTSYVLDVPSHWYLIEFGLIRSSGEKMDKSGATLNRLTRRQKLVIGGCVFAAIAIGLGCTGQVQAASVDVSVTAAASHFMVGSSDLTWAASSGDMAGIPPLGIGQEVIAGGITNSSSSWVLLSTGAKRR